MGSLVIDITKVALNNGQTFTSPPYEVGQYPSLVIAGKTDQAGKFYVDFSMDGTNWDDNTYFDIEANVFEKHRLSISNNFCRFRIVNDSGLNQSFCRFQAIASEAIFLSNKLGGNIQSDSDSIISQSLLIANTDTGIQPIEFGRNGRLVVQQPDESLDAFARLRMSQPVNIFDSKQLSDKQALIWDDQLVSGSGGATTYNTNQASTTLSVSASTSARRVRQTFRRFNYQAGKSQLIICTGVLGTPSSGITRRIGYYDDNNGLFFESKNTAVNLVVRTYTSGSAVDTTITQSNWNIDKMDGTGDSGITLDFSKTQIFVIDFEWLGVGSIRYGFFINGNCYYVHKVNNANVLDNVYMSVPNLPIRYEIINDGTGVASSITHICSTVISEGGRDATGYPFALSRQSTALTTNNDALIYGLVVVRLNSNYRTSTVKILDFSINCTSTASYNWFLILNPTITGTSLSYSQVTNSSLDGAIPTAATTFSGGTILMTGSAQQTNDGGISRVLDTDFNLGSNIAGTSDVLVLAVQRVTGTTETFYGGINWRDQQ